MYYHRTKLCLIHLRSVTQLQKRVTSFTHLVRWEMNVRRWELEICYLGFSMLLTIWSFAFANFKTSV